MTPVAITVDRFRPAPWSLAALVCAAVGVVAATWIIVGVDSEPSQVRWPLVVAPVAVSLVPVLAPRNGARLGAVVALAGWCFLTGFSIGFTQWPALFASLMALQREAR